MTVIDANDEPQLDPTQLPCGCDLTHIVPPDDEIAKRVGRGSAKHLFYWRHSPQVLERIGWAPGEFDVHADTDILFLRPFDLTSLETFLDRGRIAVAFDRSMMTYYQRLEPFAASRAAEVFPIAGSRGPMVQGGLIFRNPVDDGGLYTRMWELACRDAKLGGIGHVPWDDMAYLSKVCSQNGPCWDRVLALGQEWNYISHETRDPGVFGYVAHYGGALRLKDYLVTRYAQLFPADQPQDLPLWQRKPDIARVGYGGVGVAGDAGYDSLQVRIGGAPAPRSLSLHPPFSVTWRVARGAQTLAFVPEFNDTCRGSRAGRVRLFAYRDGSFAGEVASRNGDRRVTIECAGTECVTLIGITAQQNHCHFVMLDPRWE